MEDTSPKVFACHRRYDFYAGSMSRSSNKGLSCRAVYWPGSHQPQIFRRNRTMTDNDGVIKIKYHHLLFAALKACLRGVFLETSLDSAPLFEAFLDMGETIHME